MKKILTLNRTSIVAFSPFLFFAILGLTFQQPVPTVIATTITSGNINAPATYDCNCVPNPTTKIVVANGDTLRVNADTDVYQIEYQSNSFLKYLGNYTITTHFQ